MGIIQSRKTAKKNSSFFDQDFLKVKNMRVTNPRLDRFIPGDEVIQDGLGLWDSRCGTQIPQVVGLQIFVN